MITCGDPIASLLDTYFEELSPGLILPNVRREQGLMTRYQDKDEQTRLAEISGLCVPKSTTCNIPDLSGSSWNTFPCIIKPINSRIGGKGDICVCNSKDEYVNFWVSDDCTEVQVQQYIDKDFEFQLIGCSMDEGRKVVIPGYSRIIRQPYNTNTGYLSYQSLDDLKFDMTPVKRFLCNLGYEGLFSMEFLRGKDGRDYFMEINMRNDGNGYCVTRYGVNLPLIWFKYCSGLPIECDLSPRRKIIFMPEYSDVRNAKSVGVVCWLWQFFTADAHAVFKITDICPFFAILFSKIRGRIRRLFGNRS